MPVGVWSDPRDPAGIVSENQYFQGGANRTKEGYLREVIRDVGGLNIATAYDVNDVGVITSVLNTATGANPVCRQ